MSVEGGTRGFLLVLVLTNVTAIVINFSTARPPEFIESNIWIAWLCLPLLIVALVLAQLRPWHRDVDRYEPSAQVWQRYTCGADVIAALPVSRTLTIGRLEYGEGPQTFRAGGGDLSETEPIRLPHRFVATGTKPWGRTVVVHIITDIAYVQGIRPSRFRATYLARCKLDRGGILPFLDGAAYQDGRIAVRSEVGAEGTIVAVEYRRGRPVARSRYVVSVRAGIRYPDDVWLSSRTGSAIVSSASTETARLAFQSRQEGGLAADVFACDLDGSAMVNLTRKAHNAYDGLFRGTEEVAEWVDRHNLRIASALAVHGGTRIVADDPARSRAGRRSPGSVR